MKTDLEKAKKLLDNGGYTCVLCKEDITYTTAERGVKPLLEWLDSKTEVRGFCAADKVVGKAAAFLYVLLGVKEVYAHVMSESAIHTLSEYGIQSVCDISVQGIINRAGTGPCPMEQAVRGVDNPKQAQKAIINTLKQLYTSHRKCDDNSEGESGVMDYD